MRRAEVPTADTPILSANLLVDTLHTQTTIFDGEIGAGFDKNVAPPKLTAVHETHSKVIKSHHSECKASFRHLAPSDFLIQNSNTARRAKRPESSASGSETGNAPRLLAGVFHSLLCMLHIGK